MNSSSEQVDIIPRSFQMSEAVSRFVEHVREYFYVVMLSKHACPRCGDALVMIAESRCRCVGCAVTLDPTLEFQRCPTCGGTPRLNVRRYSCRACGAAVISRFLFDGLVFDAGYFREKMADHRERRQELRERVRQMLAASRSGRILPEPVSLSSVPGLLDALNELTCGTPHALQFELVVRFDLAAYQRHISSQISEIPVTLDEIMPLGQDLRLDRIWRFVAVIFLAHAGLAEVWQESSFVMVKQRETDREGQDVLGDAEDADGIEGPVG